ncbi:MAG: hypothetical protein IIT77_00205, partial [Oscillospiraceae bacterium]|nr:hypothetical protein [Oscillospiraceae bacterium]
VSCTGTSVDSGIKAGVSDGRTVFCTGSSVATGSSDMTSSLSAKDEAEKSENVMLRAVMKASKRIFIIIST